MLEPTGGDGGILLFGAACWSLPAPAQAAEELPNVARMEPYAGRACYDATDARQGPRVGGESRGLGTAQEHDLDAMEGGSIEPGTASGASSSLEGGPAVSTPCVVPAAGGLTTDVEAVDDGGLVEALPKQFGGSESTRFQS